MLFEAFLYFSLRIIILTYAHYNVHFTPQFNIYSTQHAGHCKIQPSGCGIASRRWDRRVGS